MLQKIRGVPDQASVFTDKEGGFHAPAELIKICLQGLNGTVCIAFLNL